MGEKKKTTNQDKRSALELADPLSLLFFYLEVHVNESSENKHEPKIAKINQKKYLHTIQ